MNCEECHEQPATLHLTQIINGKKREIHVCEACAKTKGYISYPGEGYSLHDLLTGLFSLDANKIHVKGTDPFKQREEIQCSNCKLTFDDFQRIGKFGCANCYTAFSTKLDNIFRRVHSGNTKHIGKIPKRKGSSLHAKKELRLYRKKLQDHIEREEFERAAEVRDIIKELEYEQNKGAGDNS